MPLNKNRRLLGQMDVRVYVQVPTTTRDGVSGPRKTLTQSGPYWASMEYLSRKQMEMEINTRITSFQQVRFRLRYTDALWAVVSKAGRIDTVSPDQKFDVISVSKDTGRMQFIDIIAELKE